MLLKTRAILVVVVGTVMGFSLSMSGGLLQYQPPVDNDGRAMEQAQLFAEVMQRVKREYVEPLDDAELLDAAIRGMVADLDAHSEFLDASEYRDIRISTTGSYTGIGIEIDEVDGKIMVVAPIAGSPYQPGSTITSIRSSASAARSCCSGSSASALRCLSADLAS